MLHRCFDSDSIRADAPALHRLQGCKGGDRREDVSGWILEAVGAITEDIIKNAWRKTGYSCYE